MIYENEELRLRTININAEIERGQSDIKKLRRENEQLRKEIWCLRDEYEKLDKLLKDKDDGDSSCSSCTSDSESCTSATESEENEATQNLENVQKTNLHSLRTEFDHLSVVTEETSAECSDKNSNPTNSLPKETWNILPPDESYPSQCITNGGPKHFFSPIKHRNGFVDGWGKHMNGHFGQLAQIDGLTPAANGALGHDLVTCPKTSSDLLVKTDNVFPNFSQESQGSTNSFTNGGNLEELLQDIQTISDDILQISGDISKKDENNRPYKTELSVVLMPKPMPLLGFEKYDEIKASIENLKKSTENIENLEGDFLGPYPNELAFKVPILDLSPQNFEKNQTQTKVPEIEVKKCNGITEPENLQKTENFPENDKFYTNLTKKYDSYDNLGFKNEVENTNKLNEIEEKCNNVNNINNELKNSPKVDKKIDKKEEKSPKMRKTRKVSIYFKGKKDKLARSLSLDTKIPQKKTEDSPKTTPTTEKKIFEESKEKMQKSDSKTSIFEPQTSKDDKIINSDTGKTSSDSKTSYDRKHRKSSSTSPERKHLHRHDEKKGHRRRHKKSDRIMALRRNSTSADRQRDRSFSVCTDRSHILEHRYHFDDFTNSERERTNSMSSCDSVRSRKTLPTFAVAGKIPWFGCWGNGCI